MRRSRVRTARNADVPAIRTVVDAAFAPLVARTGIRPAPPATDWETVISAMGASVATVDDHVVGVLVAWPHPDHVQVDLLAVVPEAQRCGVGTALLDRAELLAIEIGVNAVLLQTSAEMTEALAYSRRRGFVGGVEDGSDRVRLQKRLL